MKKIGIIVGSLRAGSFNKIVAQYMKDQFKENYSASLVDISDLPLYNEDLDNAKPPEQWQKFRANLAEFDAFLFVTPEYNRSMPAALKNALDIASRPYGQNLWAQKPCAVASVSIGKMGGFGASNHLRSTLLFLDARIMPQPEAYIGEIVNSLDKSANLTDESTMKFLNSVVASFGVWIDRVSIESN